MEENHSMTRSDSSSVAVKEDAMSSGSRLGAVWGEAQGAWQAGELRADPQAQTSPDRASWEAVTAGSLPLTC